MLSLQGYQMWYNFQQSAIDYLTLTWTLGKDCTQFLTVQICWAEVGYVQNGYGSHEALLT
jgi:hypothetical protein